MSSIIPVDLLAAAMNPAYFNQSVYPAAVPSISLIAYNQDFNSLLGSNATARKVYDLPWQAFHEGGVYQKSTNSMYIASNWAGSLDNPVNITVIDMADLSLTSTRYEGLYEANGGTTWYPPGSDNSSTAPAMVWCDEGDFTHYSGLVDVEVPSNNTKPVINNFLGRNYSSLNDVRQHPITGDLWFTDADYGYFQNFRPPPSQVKQVYRFEPTTGIVQVVADGFDESNGLEFSPDLKTLYVTDTGAQHFGPNATRPATIYAFDVTKDMKRLENRRTFAYPDNGFPDGIHCDTEGNVWAGCGDGVHVWNPEGILLGKIHLGETSNNFAFYPGGMLVFSNVRMWQVEGINAVGREVCKDFGVCEGSSGGGGCGHGYPW